MSLIRIVESAPARGLHRLCDAVQSPLFSGSLLAAMALAPDELLRRVPVAMGGVEVVRRALQVLLGVGLLRLLNRGASAAAANAWRVGPAPGWRWPDEVAVVTGGCSGIGLCIVRRLVARGVRVAVLDVQEPPDGLLADPLVRFYRCDITSAEKVAVAAAALRADLGHPSILVNNAGITRPMSILDMPPDVLAGVFAVNTISHWALVQQFLPDMIARNKGHIVTVASMASFIALPKGADYSATKAAALSFHESLAVELKHLYHADRVLTTVAHPNFVRTPLVKDFGHQLESRGVRMLTPDHVASVITRQIFSRRGAQLIIPPQQETVTGIRGWPTWLQVFLRDQLGADAVNVNV